MTRLNIHVLVDDLARSTEFYRGLFGREPAHADAQGAHWLLDDPALSLTIAPRAGGEPVLTRLGLEESGAAAVEARRARLTALGEPVSGEGSDGALWTIDPVGQVWELRYNAEADLPDPAAHDAQQAAFKLRYFRMQRARSRARQ